MFNRHSPLATRGGVLVEFAISCPLILLFMVGILSSGRVLNQIATVGQAAFLGAQAGSELAASEGSKELVRKRIGRILSIQNKQLPCAEGNCIKSVDFDESKKSIRVNIEGKLEYLFRELDIDVTVTAPLLMSNNLDVSNINFSNPQNPEIAYRCHGTSNASCTCCYPGGGNESRICNAC